MENSYLLSIIIPNYNNEKYLNKCLESVFKQTYKNIEVIIIDDASTDGSKKILDKYNTDYSAVKVIYNQINLGVAKSRDIAISSALGEYITTLDADDYYLDENKLKKEIEIIKKFHKEGKDNIISFSNIILVNEKGKKPFFKVKNRIEEGRVLIKFFTRSCMIPRDFVFSKKQYKKAGCFDFDIPIYEDWDLKLRFAYENEFFYTGLDGIAYRRHGKGLSSADTKKHIKWLKHIYKKNINLVEPAKRNYVKKEFNFYIENLNSEGLKNRLIRKIKKMFVWNVRCEK